MRAMAAGDSIAEQQYLDFLRMRGFRKSLLCRQERKLEAEWDASRIVGCYATHGGQRRSRTARSAVRITSA